MKTFNDIFAFNFAAFAAEEDDCVYNPKDLS